MKNTYFALFIVIIFTTIIATPALAKDGLYPAPVISTEKTETHSNDYFSSNYAFTPKFKEIVENYLKNKGFKGPIFFEIIRLEEMIGDSMYSFQLSLITDNLDVRRSILNYSNKQVPAGDIVKAMKKLAEKSPK